MRPPETSASDGVSVCLDDWSERSIPSVPAVEPEQSMVGNVTECYADSDAI